MSATVVFQQSYGQTPSVVSKTSFNFIPADDGTASVSSAPMRIPTSGTAYSYELWLQGKLSVAPASSVFNFKVWIDATDKPDGIDITANSTEVSSYTTPVNTESSQGTRVSLFNYQSYDSSLSLPGTLISVNDVTSFLILQLSIDYTAFPTSLSIPICYAYDEV